jgi:acyl-coenzyme A thioesterase PaaI-like protein
MPWPESREPDAPVSGGLVRCEASFLQQGRSLSFLQSHAPREDGALVAHATATWRRLSASPAA